MKFLEENHVCRGWIAQDVNGAGATSDIISLKNYNHCTILLDFAATDLGGDADIVVTACDDVSASHTANIATLTFRTSAATTATDAWSAETTVTDSKIDYVAAGDIVPNTCDNYLVAIEVDAADVQGASTTYDMDCLRIAFPSPGQACNVACNFILSQPRYAGATMPSAIVD